MIILGIDPGSTRAGYGLVKKEKHGLKFIRAGLLKISSKDKAQRLVDLEKSFSELLKKTRPDLVALEKLYFVKNIKTGMEVAESKGVLTLLVARSKIPFIEYAPSEVKAGVTGYGNADKKAVGKMVAKILGVDKINGPDDVTDALAIAITAANQIRQKIISK